MSEKLKITHSIVHSCDPDDCECGQVFLSHCNVDEVELVKISYSPAQARDFAEALLREANRVELEQAKFGGQVH